MPSVGDEPGFSRLAGISPKQIAAALAHATLNTPPKQHPDGLTRAAVLMPFLWSNSAWHILFTRRTNHLETHKGQVAFPGGSVDPEDANLSATALREAFEETGILPKSVLVLGQMAEMVTITKFLVTPVLGVVEWPQPLILAEAEVSRAFTIPLAWLADPQHVEVKPYLRPNGHIEQVVFFNQYDGETVWGVTGRIMYDLIQLLQEFSV
jgi:8-oxo-dGTP pyrophosphatase MutT (NUDIX family)